MKKLQRTLLVVITLLMAGMQTSCTDYQDEIDAMDFRVTELEKKVSQINSELEAMQLIVKAMEEGDYIINVTENSQGYIITFKKSGAVFIKHGENGLDGKDAQAPNIGIAQDTDGLWYWTLDGEWLLADGNKVRADGKNGKDGKDGKDGENGQDGKDGKDGKDAISPQVRINPMTNIWEISVDGGLTWITTGTVATGNDGKDGANGKDGKDGIDGKDGKDGQDGKDGKDGEDGQDGKDGNQLFEKIYYEVNADGEFMVIVTKAGQTFRIPIYTNS